ncbi:helix-turn-helix domain-containing protein [Paracoccus sp. PS-1]|uniref:helix-turn-helix domain-containing protein n=1 Tax=Paracoccus sp. PS1 TaxID=2963938 RepID=UPI0027E3C5A2|nr:helix-turn-helix domain-containing protein [Paracoccus sp. PS1]MDQ7262689.1 helix-turn-helix domain-containing protein [Paracoccus sp. PS1]
MSVKIMSAVFESETLGPTERLIMLALADHADDTGRCYPSMQRLCQRTGLSERAVQVNIKKLQGQGYIKVVSGGGKGRPNIYFVSANPAPETPHQKPRFSNTVSDDIQTPHLTTPNPAPDAPEPSRTIIEPSESNGARDALLTVLSQEAADAFIDHRKAKRAKLTVRAAQLIAKDLTHHPNPDAVVEASIKNGWTGVFPEKFGGPRDQSPQQNRHTAADDRFGRIADAAVRNRAPSRPDFGFG